MYRGQHHAAYLSPTVNALCHQHLLKCLSHFHGRLQSLHVLIAVTKLSPPSIAPACASCWVSSIHPSVIVNKRLSVFSCFCRHSDSAIVASPLASNDLCDSPPNIPGCRWLCPFLRLCILLALFCQPLLICHLAPSVLGGLRPATWSTAT